MPPTPKMYRKTQAAAPGVAKKKPSSHTMTKKSSPTAAKNKPASTVTKKKPAVHTQHKLTAASGAQQGQDGSQEHLAMPSLTPQQRQAWGTDHRQYTRRCTMKGPLGGEWQLVSCTEHWVLTCRPT